MQTVRTVRLSTNQHSLRGATDVDVDVFFAQVKQERFTELFESRAQAEDQAASMRIPRNHLLVSSLVALLEERQSGGGGGDNALRQLAEKFAMDVERLESLVRSVNVPRLREGGVRYIRDERSGEETAISEVGSPSTPFSSLSCQVGVECFTQVAWRESVVPLDS